MNKVIVVGSSINPRQGRFTYSETRSKFDAEERFRQTIFTVNSLQNALPGAKIIIVDSSDDVKDYRFNLSYHNNVQFVQLKEISPEAHEIVNTHPNKSLCESLLLNTFYKYHKSNLLRYDFILKATGRYFYYKLKDDLFTEENRDAIFFKTPLSFEWNDSWKYDFVDRRSHQYNNRLHQYCTVLYGFGSSQLNTMMDINEATIHLLNQPSMNHYDIETLSYYFTRQYESKVIETDWIVSGWDGTSGRYMYY